MAGFPPKRLPKASSTFQNVTHLNGLGQTMRPLPCLSSDTLALPSLPIVNMEKDSLWTSYLRRVYPGRRGTVDLNTFNFFYWDAPISLETINYCDWTDGRPHLEEGTPWIGGWRYWNFGPEHMLSRLGFFVVRTPSRARTLKEIADGELEVLRYGPNWFVQGLEIGNAWFYHTIGSGVYLDCANLRLSQLRYRLTAYRGRNPFPINISAPREEVVFETNSSEFWSDRLRFHTYSKGICSFTPSTGAVLRCDEQRSPIVERHLPLFCATPSPPNVYRNSKSSTSPLQVNQQTYGLGTVRFLWGLLGAPKVRQWDRSVVTEKGDVFVPGDTGYIYRFPGAFQFVGGVFEPQDNAWVEVMHFYRRRDHFARRSLPSMGQFWMYSAPGSGIWYNIGRALRRNTAGESSPGCKYALENGYDSYILSPNNRNLPPNQSHYAGLVEIVDCAGAKQDQKNLDRVWEHGCPPPNASQFKQLHNGLLEPCECNRTRTYLNCISGGAAENFQKEAGEPYLFWNDSEPQRRWRRRGRRRGR